MEEKPWGGGGGDSAPVWIGLRFQFDELTRVALPIDLISLKFLIGKRLIY